MNIKKAVNIARNGKEYTWLEVMESASVIQQALADGYTLCKVDEAIEQMKELQNQENKGIYYYSPPYYSERCIKIIKEACDE